MVPDEYNNGDKWWIQFGKLHRADGPAIEMVCGYKAWYLNGIGITKPDI